MAKKASGENLTLRASRTQWHEYPKGKKGLVFCKICNAVYYKKAWHHNLQYHNNLREDLQISFTVCPACTAIQNKKYEGRIIIANVPKEVREHLENLIHAFTHRAFQKDPMDRLIAVKDTCDGMEITTTENQLAAKLAKKIHEVFKKTVEHIAFAHNTTKATEIRVQFKA